MQPAEQLVPSTQSQVEQNAQSQTAEAWSGIIAASNKQPTLHFWRDDVSLCVVYLSQEEALSVIEQTANGRGYSPWSFRDTMLIAAGWYDPEWSNHRDYKTLPPSLRRNEYGRIIRVDTIHRPQRWPPRKRTFNAGTASAHRFKTATRKRKLSMPETETLAAKAAAKHAERLQKAVEMLDWACRNGYVEDPGLTVSDGGTGLTFDEYEMLLECLVEIRQVACPTIPDEPEEREPSAAAA